MAISYNSPGREVLQFPFQTRKQILQGRSPSRPKGPARGRSWWVLLTPLEGDQERLFLKGITGSWPVRTEGSPASRRDLSSLGSPFCSSTRQEASRPGYQGPEGCFLVPMTASPAAVRPSSLVKPWCTQRLGSAASSTPPTSRGATRSAPHPRTASSGCDKATRGPCQLTSLCQKGHPVARLRWVAEGRPKRGRASHG